MAEAWIEIQPERFATGAGVSFAITRRSDQALLGGIALVLDQDHAHGNLGYWIGKPYWGQGYCTEAARAVVAYGFEVRQLNRVFAAHFKSNPASGRVMEKIGLVYEGCFQQHWQRWGTFEDAVYYGLIRDKYEKGKL